jgi:hypothetical protein
MIIGWGMGVGEGVNVLGARLGFGVSVFVGGSVAVSLGRVVAGKVAVAVTVSVGEICTVVGGWVVRKLPALAFAQPVMIISTSREKIINIAFCFCLLKRYIIRIKSGLAVLLAALEKAAGPGLPVLVALLAFKERSLVVFARPIASR